MQKTTEAGFKDAVLLPSFQKPVVVLFSAVWCGPCKILKPVIERLAGELSFPLANVDAGEERGLASFYSIRGVPTLAVFRNGKVVATSVGGKTEAQIKDFLFKNEVTQNQLEF